MQGSSTASSTSRSSGVDGNGGLGGGDSSEASEVAIAKCGRAGSPFADEDDLYADRDDGVYMQSSSSSASPAASERLPRPNLHSGGRGSEAGAMQPPPRPASCTFGTQGDNHDVRHRLFLQQPRNHSTFTQHQPPQPRGRNS